MLNITKADLQGSGSNLTLEVIVIAPTLGWKVELSPLVYIVPPEDGVQEFELIGTPPTQIVGQALETHIIAVSVPVEQWFNGVGIKVGKETHLKILKPTREQPSVGTDIVMMDQPGIRSSDKLVVPVRYGGGCRKHKFQLNWDGQVMESAPPQIELQLSHNDNDDPCKALISEDLQFDLSVLEGLPSGRVIIHVKSSTTAYSIEFIN